MELTETTALELYEVADKYMQNNLLRLCEEYLCRNLGLDNLASMIEFTEKFEVTGLKETIFEFIIKNLMEIKEKYTEYKIPEAYLWEVLVRVSQRSPPK